MSSPWPAFHILHWIMRISHRLYVLGDFEERYRMIRREKGCFIADLWYWCQLIKSLPGFLTNEVIWSGLWVKNALLVFRRIIRRYTIPQLINVIGLVLGIWVSMMLGLYIQDELSYDRFHAKAHRIYRLMTEIRNESGLNLDERCPGALIDFLKAHCSQVERTGLFWQNLDVTVSTADRSRFIGREAHLYADDDFWRMFTFTWLDTLPGFLRDDPYRVILREDLARYFFHTEKAAGQTLTLNGTDFTVAGVFQTLSSKTHLPQFKLATSLSSVENEYQLKSWSRGLPLYGYVMLREGVSATDFEVLFNRSASPHFSDVDALSSVNRRFRLQPLTDIHLHSPKNENQQGMPPLTRIRLYGTLGFLLLLIACINSVTFSSAFSLTRIKEIGLRKSMGASRVQLVIQFIIESCCVSMLALAAGFALVRLFLPVLNRWTSKTIQWESLFSSSGLLLIIAIFICSGVLTALYPAIHLSSIQSSLLMRSRFILSRLSPGRSPVRNGLVQVQFFITSLLMILLGVIFFQIQFIDQTDKGYDSRRVVVLPVHTPPFCQALQDQWESVRNDLLHTPNVQAATAHIGAPGKMSHMSDIELTRNGVTQTQWVGIHFADEHFRSTYGLSMIAGRFYRGSNREKPPYEYVMNESAVRAYGFKDARAALGASMSMWGWKGVVVGVMKDFHTGSFYHELGPLVMMNHSFMPEAVSVRIGPLSNGGDIRRIAELFRQRFPGAPIEPRLLWDDLNRAYASEIRFGEIIFVMTFLAGGISLFGLLGLSLFSAARKCRELGIRKVFGATSGHLLFLFTREQLQGIGLAMIFSWPVAWMVCQKWLEHFVYHIEIPWWLFPFSGLVMALVAWTAVALLMLKAARTSPARILKEEA